MELLIPVGNFDNLVSAVENGADAIYLGLKRFNARVKAGNFSIGDLGKAVSFAHQKGVKVYLALNTLVKNNELEDYFNLLKEAYLKGIDAVIIQEISFARIIKKYFPGLEVHASTQARLQNLDGLKYFDRVILPRELSKEEIKKISKKTKIPLEIFVQGALCFSVSGLCLMSSFIGQRSGNRGICAQPCRKKYNNKYLMSMKDLSLIDYVTEIGKLKISSIKIEGRLRSKKYVELSTQIYRKALDGKKITDEDKQILKSAFNRNLTTGFYGGDLEKTSPHNLKFQRIEKKIYTFKNKKNPIIKKNLSIKNNFNDLIKEINNLTQKSSSEEGLYLKIHNLKDINKILAYNHVKIIFYYIDHLDVKEAKDIVKNSGKKFYIYLPTIMSDDEIIKYVKKVEDINPDGLLLNTPKVSEKFNSVLKKNSIMYDYGLNVFNDLDLEYFGRSIISPELSYKDLINFKNKDFLVLVHGNLSVMVTKNILPCSLKYDDKFTYPVKKEHNYNIVYNSKDIAYLDKVLLLKQKGITQFYLDLDRSVKKWVDIYSKILNGEKLNFKKLSKGFTLGHFNKPV